MNDSYLSVESGGEIGPFKVIRLIGEFDLNEVSGFERKLEELLTEDSRYVVLDMSELEYLDSSGIGCVVRLYRDTEEKQSGKLFIFNPPPFIKELFQISNLTSFLKLITSQQELEETCLGFNS